MGWTATNPVSVGDATKKADWDKLWDNAAFHRNSSGNFEITKSDADEALNIADSNSSTQHSVSVTRSAGSGNALNISNSGSGNSLTTNQTSDKVTHGTTTKYLMISPTSFVPTDDTLDFTTGINLGNRTTLTSQSFYAPVNLPDGAIVTTLTLYGSLSHANSSLTSGLIKRNTQASITTSMASVTISGNQGGYATNSTSSITAGTIDNSGSQHYYIKLDIDPGAAVSDCVCTGVMITYTVANLKQTI